MDDVKIGGVTITKGPTSIKRFTQLLWGPSGSGKTTLACTAPGKKLLINFDPGGPESVSHMDDVSVLDLAAEGQKLVPSFKNANNPLGLKSIIDEYDTFIFDSLTNVAHIALQEAVAQAPKSTVEFPGIPGYTLRNTYMVQFVKNLLALTGRHNKHCIMIAHEAAPTTNDDGMILHITMSLSGDMPNRASIDFSEVWNLTENKKGQQTIMVRPARLKQPCKTRMFGDRGTQEFVWKFDSDTQEGMKIADWWEEYTSTGKKISLPT